MNDDQFLKELKFFNENPNKASNIDESIVWFYNILAPIVFLILMLSLKNETISNYGDLLISLFVCGILLSPILKICIYKKNERYMNFKYMLFKGEVSDLFGDLSSINIAPYLNFLKKDLKEYNGIRGETAYHVLKMMNDKELKKIRKETDIANQKIKEIDEIQKTTV